MHIKKKALIADMKVNEWLAIANLNARRLLLHLVRFFVFLNMENWSIDQSVFL